MNYDDICYIRSCLSQVIIRLDFLEFIDNNILFGSSVEREVLNSFPRKGMQQIVRFQTMNVIADPNGTRAEQTTRDGVQQEFSDPLGNKMVLSNKFIIMEINQYTNYEEVMQMFVPVLKQLLERIRLTSMRTGIRYINFFSDEGLRPKKNYFVASVGALFDSKQSNGNCIRSMAMNEYIVEDMRLNFRFGMYNPQYPQLMKKANFVLDYDCFCDEAVVGFDAMMSHIQKGHDMIQRAFEDSITEQLRKVMRNE